MKKAVLFSLLMLAVNSLGQQEPQTRKVDEFQNPNCEDISVRLDNFGIQIANNPNSTGFVAINGQRNSFRKNLVFEGMIKTYFEKRKLANGRLVIVRSSNADALTIRFWIVPTGGKSPNVEEGAWSYTIDKTVKPSMFAWSGSDDGICPEVDDVKILASLLAANPNSHTNVVIRVSSNQLYLRKRRRMSNELMHKYGISKNQIRFFKAAEPNNRMNIWEPSEEYWLVP